MRRVISVWFPHWPTDRLRRRLAEPSADPAQPSADPPKASPDPIVTALHDGRRRVVAGLDQRAAALGLRTGMAMAQAMALLPGLTVYEADPAADAEALRRLALWCQRYTPLTSLCGTDGLWLDVTGCAPLFGGEASLLRRLRTRLTQDGLDTRVALADTPGLAHALARYGEGEGRSGQLAPEGCRAEALGPLPVAALRLSPELEATLRRLGFEQIGHLARIPRALLARRFGPLPGLRLDQAYGHVHEPLIPLAPEHTLQRRDAFLEPLLTAEALQIATAHLVDPLCAEMERAGLGARRLDLLFERVDGRTLAVRIGTARPTRDARHLTRLLDEQLETIDPGLGIEAMRLLIPVAQALAWEQQEGRAGPQDVAPLVDRLSNRLGPERVYRATPVESDLPERTVHHAPALQEAPALVKLRRKSHLRVLPQLRAGWPGRLEAPCRLLTPPRPIMALAALPDQPPVAFTWRGHRHRVKRADGPERIHGEWWRMDQEVQSVRDYFRVEDERGQRFWLFRAGDGADPGTGTMEWFLHGLF